MEKVRLSSKGQVILPKSVRSARGWQPGMEFVVEEVAEGVLLKPLKPFESTRLEDIIGCAGYKGPAKTLEEMEQAIEQGVKERHARSGY